MQAHARTQVQQLAAEHFGRMKEMRTGSLRNKQDLHEEHREEIVMHKGSAHVHAGQHICECACVDCSCTCL